MGKLFSIIAMFLALAVGICGCIETVKGALGLDTTVEVPVRPPKPPKIRPGVALAIQVGSVGAKPVQMSVLVDQAGTITLPHLLLSPVSCEGLTLETLQKKLTKLYTDFYRQPQVTVTFGPVSQGCVSPWGTVKVMGQVGNPGPVNLPSTMDLTVMKALQLAGGCRPFADRSAIRVNWKDDDGRQHTYVVDLHSIGKGHPERDIVLCADDVIVVPETIW